MAVHSDFGGFAAALAGNAGSAARLRLLQPNQLSAGDLLCWNALAVSTSTASAFAQPWFLQVALTCCDPSQGARLAVIEFVDGEWIGAFPIVKQARHGRAPLPNWQAWRHPNQFVAAPLVRSGFEPLFWQTLLDGLGAESGSELALCLADLPVDDPSSTALFALSADEARPIFVDRRIERPALCANALPMLEPKQRRRLNALTRKLTGELGEPEFRTTRDPIEIDRQIEAFLALEQSGWKGDCGSALACSADTQSLFAGIARNGSLLGNVEFASLHAGGQLLAFSTLLIGKGRTYGFKMAYQESAARFAPGVLLLNWLTARHCQWGGDDVIDSCTLPNSQPASRLWSDRCALIDCRIALGGPMRRRAMQAVTAGESAFSWFKRLGNAAGRPAKS